MGELTRAQSHTNLHPSEANYALSLRLRLRFKVVRDPCQKITLLLLKSKSVRVIVPESCFLKENTYL